MLNACEQHAFYSMIRSVIVPRVEQASIPFFYLQKDQYTNSYEQGTVGKDRTGVMLRIGDGHFILTASHNIPEMVEHNIYLFMSWDEQENAPIPITTDEIAVSDDTTLDVAAIKLSRETAARLLRRHTPLSLADISGNCRESDGLFLIVGYPRAFTEFITQEWNDPKPHAPITNPLTFICKRKQDGWKHTALKYDEQIHIVVGMPQDSLSATSGEAVVLPDHAGIEGISGCGIWMVADRKKRKPLSEFGLSDCKLVAIEHRYDDDAGRVAGTWIDLALAFLALKFPETQEPMKLVYPQSPAIWTPRK